MAPVAAGDRRNRAKRRLGSARGKRPGGASPLRPAPPGDAVSRSWRLTAGRGGARDPAVAGPAGPLRSRLAAADNRPDRRQRVYAQGHAIKELGFRTILGGEVSRSGDGDPLKHPRPGARRGALGLRGRPQYMMAGGTRRGTAPPFVTESPATSIGSWRPRSSTTASATTTASVQAERATRRPPHRRLHPAARTADWARGDGTSGSQASARPLMLTACAARRYH